MAPKHLNQHTRSLDVHYMCRINAILNYFQPANRPLNEIYETFLLWLANGSARDKHFECYKTMHRSNASYNYLRFFLLVFMRPFLSFYLIAGFILQNKTRYKYFTFNLANNWIETWDWMFNFGLSLSFSYFLLFFWR